MSTYNLTNSLKSQNVTSTSDITSDDATWILTSSFVIFTMQTGFGLLESGACSKKNEVNIMMKNVVDVVLGKSSYIAQFFQYRKILEHKMIREKHHRLKRTFSTCSKSKTEVFPQQFANGQKLQFHEMLISNRIQAWIVLMSGNKKNSLYNDNYDCSSVYFSTSCQLA